MIWFHSIAVNTSRMSMVLLLLLQVFSSWNATGQSFDPGAYPVRRMDFSLLSIEDGLSQGMVNSIIQDSYGFMWFGTKDGLNRYDGYTFRIFRHEPSDSTSLASSFINIIYEDKSGRLWVGTSTGIDLFDRATEKFHHIDLTQNGNSVGAINHIVADIHGDFWIAHTQGLVKLIINGTDVRGIPSYQVRWFSVRQSTISAGSDHRLWGDLGDGECYVITPDHQGQDELIQLRQTASGAESGPAVLKELVVIANPATGIYYGVHRHGIVQLDNSGITAQVLFDLPEEHGMLTNHMVEIDQAGNLWIPSYSGLFRYSVDAGRLERILSKDYRQDQLAENVKCCYTDQQGLLWAGTSGYGILKHNPRNARFQLHPDRSIRCIQPGQQGSIITCRYDELLNVYSPAAQAYVLSVMQLAELHPSWINDDYFGSSDYTIQDTFGNYWLSALDLIKYNPSSGELKRFKACHPGTTERDGIRFPMYFGRDGNIWSGGDSALWRFDPTTEQFTRYAFPLPTINNPYPFVTCITEAEDGMIWIGTLLGVLRLNPTEGTWQHYANDPDSPNSLSVDIVFSIAPDPQSPATVFWIGTNGGGLHRLDSRTNEIRRFTTADGLPNDVIYGILADDDGSLWMSTNKGLSRYTPATGQFRNFSSGDGLQSDEFNRHAYCKTQDGRLFFGGVSGFNYFNPSELKDDTTSVTVRITDIRILNKSIEFGADGSYLSRPAYMSGELSIPHRENSITFFFATMHFADPDRHRYQYKLEGFDGDWIDAGVRNFANYTNLDPGTYFFYVRGDNPDGIWSKNPAVFRLVILPPWYLTWWFFTLAIITVFGAVLLYTRQLRKQRLSLEIAVSERTHELRRQKDRSEELLNNILPQGISNLIKQDKKVEARKYEVATVLFCDFKGFTSVSEQLSASELVSELNVCINAFDRITEKYGIEKIRTIGDAYLAVGGVPDPSKGPPLSVVHAALEMQRSLKERYQERSSQGKPGFEMRVGIHTGPVIAGMVGQRKFQYDIWGATVQIASLIERHGQAGEVCISSATLAYLGTRPDIAVTEGTALQLADGSNIQIYVIADSTTADEIKSAPHADRKKEIPTSAQQGSGKSDLSGLRILLVEDNTFNVMVAQDELSDAIPGVRIDLAANGEIAVSKAAKNTYDIILMDVQMPVMDGYDATRAIRKLAGTKGKIPIIALTANAMQAEIDRCIEAGMNDFVAKPFNQKDLIEAVRRNT